MLDLLKNKGLTPKYTFANDLSYNIYIYIYISFKDRYNLRHVPFGQGGTNIAGGEILCPGNVIKCYTPVRWMLAQRPLVYMCIGRKSNISIYIVR